MLPETPAPIRLTVPLRAPASTDALPYPIGEMARRIRAGTTVLPDGTPWPAEVWATLLRQRHDEARMAIMRAANFHTQGFRLAGATLRELAWAVAVQEAQQEGEAWNPVLGTIAHWGRWPSEYRWPAIAAAAATLGLPAPDGYVSMDAQLAPFVAWLQSRHDDTVGWPADLRPMGTWLLPIGQRPPVEPGDDPVKALAGGVQVVRPDGAPAGQRRVRSGRGKHVPYTSVSAFLEALEQGFFRFPDLAYVMARHLPGLRPETLTRLASITTWSVLGASEREDLEPDLARWLLERVLHPEVRFHSMPELLASRHRPPGDALTFAASDQQQAGERHVVQRLLMCAPELLTREERRIAASSTAVRLAALPAVSPDVARRVIHDVVKHGAYNPQLIPSILTAADASPDPVAVLEQLQQAWFGVGSGHGGASLAERLQKSGDAVSALRSPAAVRWLFTNELWPRQERDRLLKVLTWEQLCLVLPAYIATSPAAAWHELEERLARARQEDVELRVPRAVVIAFTQCPDDEVREPAVLALVQIVDRTIRAEEATAEGARPARAGVLSR